MSKPKQTWQFGLKGALGITTVVCLYMAMAARDLDAAAVWLVPVTGFALGYFLATSHLRLLRDQATGFAILTGTVLTGFGYGIVSFLRLLVLPSSSFPDSLFYLLVVTVLPAIFAAMSAFGICVVLAISLRIGTMVYRWVMAIVATLRSSNQKVPRSTGH